MSTDRAPHSPLPWTMESDGLLVIRGEVQLPIGPDRNRAEQRANTALIVRAVNAHQQLVDALRALISSCEKDGCEGYAFDQMRFWTQDARTAARAALRAATQ